MEVGMAILNDTTARRMTSFTFLFILLTGLIGCSEGATPTDDTSTSMSCRGIYYTRDRQGTLHKFNEWFNKSVNACYTDNLELSRWEETSEKWDKNKVQCKPQPQFNSRSLVSANNYYQYRNGKDFLDLDASTGIFRRLTIGEDDDDTSETGLDGITTFKRWQGCFYQRTAQGIDAIYGHQILLDGDSSKIKTSEPFNPMEIFSYTESATSIEMVRFDSSNDWDWKFCPESSTPWGYCNLLRNGNIWFFPVLSAAEQADLLAQALLIRRQFNFNLISKSDFENVWTNAEKTHKEIGLFKENTTHIWNFKYMVNGLPDTPMFVDQAWRDYIKGLRPQMPDLSSIQILPICYEGKREVILNNGSLAWINGEICYENGNYVFTEK